MAVDLSQITQLTSQVKALQDAASQTSDPSTKALLNAQAQVAEAQLQAAAAHAQAQADASSNVLDNLALWSTLTGVVGGAAPSIVALFKK
jgi:hypothetical protein